MARVVTAQCPNCGAGLELDDRSAVAVCGYCKTSCQIQRHRQRVPPPPVPVFIPGAPPPPPAAHQPVIMVQSGSPAGCIVAGLAVGLLVVGGAAAFFVLGAANTSSGSSSTFTSPISAITSAEDRFQFSSKVLLFDVDDDGTMDAIGENRSFSDGEKHWLAAFDGKDGKPMWKSEAIDKSIFSEGRAGLAGSRLITVDALGKVRAFDAKTGEADWTAKIAERAETLCAGKGFVGIPTQDQGFSAFDDRTGKPEKAAKREACAPIPTTERDVEAESFIAGWAEFDEVGLPDDSPHFIKGYSAHYALVPRAGKIRYLLGEKQPGSGVPMIIAHDDKKQLWVTELPKEEPLNAEPFRGTVVAGYGRGKLVVVYERKNDEGLRLSCLDGESGKHEWDVAVPKNPGDVPSGIAVSKHSVFFTTWTHLHVYSLKSGKARYSIGQF
jgi:hypothetical protein